MPSGKFRGLAPANLGRNAEATQECRRGTAHMPLSRHGFNSPGWLKADPEFRPLRGNPRFERLISGRS